MAAIPSRLKHLLGIWALTVAIAFVAGGALAHEYDHALHKHDAPCAQHFFAGNLEAGAAASQPPAFAPVAVSAFGFLPTYHLPSRFAAAYRGRAPPRFV
jgi:hypothetical protein